MADDNFDLLRADEIAKGRDDILFRSGHEILRRAVKSGRKFTVFYMADDPAVVDTIVFHA